jgi:hypothetical protein
MLVTASLAAASPLVVDQLNVLEKRQSSANDLTSGGCKSVMLIFARGTTEPGNIGMIADFGFHSMR